MKLRIFLFLIGLVGQVIGFELPLSTKQCLLGVADDWNSSRVRLQWFERQGREWVRHGEPWEARLGREGLAWGRGLSPARTGGKTKREGDWRSPAGVFLIGGVWGRFADVKRHPELPYHRITTRDLWVEDPASASYNRHVRLDHEPATDWEKKAQMKQDDPAHALKLFIAHNAEPDIVPGAGSSIFFHIWRSGGGKPTAGCTTMAEFELRRLITRIAPQKRPVYVLLPKAEYQQLRAAWKLP